MPTSPTSPLSLIVTADDFGIGVRTSQGIIQAHLNGPVTATSLMVVTGDHARASVPLLAEAPRLEVGLHVVLTNCGEKPLVARRSSGLVDRAGNFFSNGRLWIQAFLGRLKCEPIAEEIAAQAMAFTRLMGRAPAYVDCHHHAHQLPTIREALVDVMERGLLPRVSRVTVEPDGMIQAVHSVRMKRRLANQLGSRAVKTFARAGVWTNDSYFGMLAARDLDRPFPWDEYLKHLPPTGAVEWVVHPGLLDDTLTGRDGYRVERVKELEALTSEERVWGGLREALSSKSAVAGKFQ